MQMLTFKIALHGVSPMIWRRLCLDANTTLAGFHQIIQIAMDWNYEHHYFHIYGQDFGSSPDAGIHGSNAPYEERLQDFDFDVGDLFTYISNFADGWLCHIRIEAKKIESQDSPPPRCLSGNGKIGADRYYKTDEWRTAIRLLNKAVASTDTITMDDIRQLLRDYEAVSFNRQKTNVRLQTLPELGLT